MKNISLILSLSLGMMFIFNACVTETKSLEKTDIVGDWQLKEAFRDGKKTGTLESVYFSFKEDGTMKSNFNMSMEEMDAKYEIKNGTIEVGGAHPLKINVERTLENELVFKTGISNAKFKLHLEPLEIGSNLD